MKYCCYRIIENILQVRIFKSDVERSNSMKKNKGYRMIDDVKCVKCGKISNVDVFATPKRRWA